MAWLKGFSLPLEVISASVDALFSLGQSDNVKDTMVTIHTGVVFLKRHFHKLSVHCVCVCMCVKELPEPVLWRAGLCM